MSNQDVQAKDKVIQAAAKRALRLQQEAKAEGNAAKYDDAATYWEQAEEWQKAINCQFEAERLRGAE